MSSSILSALKMLRVVLLIKMAKAERMNDMINEAKLNALIV